MKAIIHEYGGALVAAICGISVTGLVAGYLMDSQGPLSRVLAEIMRKTIG